MAEQFKVTLVGGRELLIHPVFGDYAAFEELRGVNLSNYTPGINDVLMIAWIAGTRLGLTQDLDYPTWRSEVAGFEDQSAGDTLNPTQPAVSAGD